MFEDNYGGFKPTEVEGVEFLFKVGDVIETIPTGREKGRIKQITFSNGYYWYDFEDGSVAYVRNQDKWRKVEVKYSVGILEQDIIIKI